MKQKADPRRQALKDMAEYMREQNIPTHRNNGDAWNVVPSMLDKKAVRRQNQKLGLWSINRFKDKTDQ